MVLSARPGGRGAGSLDLLENRHGRFRDSDLLRHVFEAVLRRCIEENLVGGDGFAVDGSLIRADASRQKGVEVAQGLASEMSSRAVDEYLAVLDDAAFRAATEVTPKFISAADPAARLGRARSRRGALLCTTGTTSPRGQNWTPIGGSRLQAVWQTRRPPVSIERS